MSDIPQHILSKAREIYEGSWPDPVLAIAQALMQANNTPPAQKAGERDDDVKLVVETIGDDVLLSLKGKIQSEVFIPAGILPGVIQALQQIQNEKWEIESL